MLANIFSKTLRDHRWGIIGWGLGLGVVIVVVIMEYGQFIKDTNMAAFAKSYQAFGFLIGEFTPIDTLGGFLTIETVVYGALLLGLWAAVTGIATTRGEEEPGTLDVLMSTPQSRLTIFWQKMAALFVALVTVSLLIGIMFFVGLFLAGETLPFWAIMGTMLNIGAAASFWGAAGVLTAQFISRRRMASIFIGTLIFSTYLLNSTAETVPSLKGLTWITPFHYYNMSKPLVPGRALDWTGVFVLLAGTAVMLAFAAWLFARRDAGVGFSFMPARHTARIGSLARPPSMAMLGSIFAKNLRDLIVPTLLWGFGLAAYCAIMVATTNEALTPMYEVMNQMPWFTKLFGSLSSNEAYLSVGIFFYLPLVLILFALTQVWGWASDEEDGRMEALVSEPAPRWQVAVAAYAAATTSLAVILALIAGGTLLTARLVSLDVDSWHVVGAVLATAPLVLVTLAFGLALATWLPRPGPAVGLTGALVVLMFFVYTLAPMFDWPGVVSDLTVFHYYGRPVLDGIAWGDMGLLMAAALLFALASLIGFQRRDIAR